MYNKKTAQPTPDSKISLFQPSVVFHDRNHSFDLQCKSNDWFLHEMHYWAEMDQIENNNSHVGHTICFIKKQPPGVFYEKSVLENFTNFTGKH